jgi:nicotinamide phosphoribosyltransferase
MYNLENPDYKGIAEYQVFKRLIETYPTGILSVVSDTFDLFKVITEYLPRLKGEILERDGKLVIRPDSGDPVDILCGAWEENRLPSGNYEKTPKSGPEGKGVIELLWDVFGGTVNEQGYKVLDSHIGAIYGDSITISRADEICKRLAAKGFASTNVVLGIGSFTYQYNTRDTFGFAMKATYVEVNGEGREIFKDPITDDGTKKSATGLLSVIYDDNNGYKLVDKVDWVTTNEGALQTIYKNGQHLNQTSLEEIRNSLKSEKSNKAMMV